MEENIQKSRLSLAYIEAVASCAGYEVDEPKVDMDSVDGVLKADFGRRPRIEFQAKATSQDVIQGANIHFRLPNKNYDDLRIDAINPRILIVFLMPQENLDWINQTAEELCMRHCAYWLSLKGEPETSYATRTPVQVPLSNMFDVYQLNEMMQRTEAEGAL